ncbi:hypothetical protein Q9Q94_05075 [Uliginosibacterium sp. 31-16]|uniref:hypothetical protein n=1 Tax=Uliginosibacterium sp. 31-16 TaxID=3068315 RepID=UPI00273D173B|nr:hypothetical protein [Uliginosibacterium sp. 31-16]MDP5238889.1 hypothetical protein [Uliginosibacterium sp. 31-16]
MIREMTRGLLIALLGLQAGVSMAAPPPACFVPQKKFDNRFIGNWQIAEWNVRYSIVGKGREICLYGRDAQGDEWFEISELKWNGKVLSATFLMPSTQWRTHSRLSLVEADRIRDDYTSKEGKQTDYWTRRK